MFSLNSNLQCKHPLHNPTKQNVIFFMINTSEFQNVFTDLNIESIYPKKLAIPLSNGLDMQTFDIEDPFEIIKNQMMQYLQEVEAQCEETMLSKSKRFKASAKIPILSQECHFK